MLHDLRLTSNAYTQTTSMASAKSYSFPPLRDNATQVILPARMLKDTGNRTPRLRQLPKAPQKPKDAWQ